jgi:bleomycin hydrolase
MKYTILLVSTVLFSSALLAQSLNKDKGTFKTYEPGYFQNSILKGIEEFELKEIPKKQFKSFRADASTFEIPTSKDDFKTYWHNKPVSQGNTNTCWSFSTTSFLESEVYRTTGQQVKLSEVYTVYYEYLERAENWIKSRGNMNFGEGSEGNAVIKIWKKYGIVPLADYSGLKPGQTFHNHAKMFQELKDYADFVKKNNIWDEAAIVTNFRSIMDYYIGEPPTKITVNNKQMTPLEYMTNVLKFNPNDYCDVLSYMQQPYWKQVEYEVPDNWWHDASYYNIPLDDFMTVFKKAIKAGYTMAIGGDVSEAGFLAREANAAVIPSFDIPSAAIDENARQFRFSNETTTDDHGMHVVGYLEKDGVTWFLVKDSGAGSRTGGIENNKNFGYYFFHEDYVKLKMMDFTVHKDMLKDLLPKFIK